MAQDKSTALSGSNSAFIEQLHARYLEDSGAVDESWRAFFAELDADANGALGNGSAAASWARDDWPEVPVVEGFEAAATAAIEQASAAKGQAAPTASAATADARSATLDSIRALMLVRAFRVRGHLQADLDPLGLMERPDHSELDPLNYGFGEEDYDRPIFIDHVLGLETATLSEILVILRRTYCSIIGVEFMHISEPAEKAWVQERIEGRDKEVKFSPEGKKAILAKLIEAEEFEHFLNRKFPGTKRFGLDGGEALIPAMESIIKVGGQLGVKEIVIGMPHRGRLSVLANVMAKPLAAIFSEFQGASAQPDDVSAMGDVKYHLGASSDREFDNNLVHLSLSANPSHLEAVDPVVLGKVRAKQGQWKDLSRSVALPVLMHGDAAFSGQGLVAECFGLAGARGHRSGGAIHIVVNNQIGFTTAPKDTRISPYPSDMSKMVQAPIYHVNGDDPEAVTHVMKIATEFRQLFKRDVVVDMYCYRRYGHNEGDDPSFTQPLMYDKIASHPSTRNIYAKKLVAEGLLSEAEVEQMALDCREAMQQGFDAAAGYKPNKADWLEGQWAGIEAASGDARRGHTAVEMAALRQVGGALTALPDDLNIHKTLKRILANKAKMLEPGGHIDWATGEALAFGTLIDEGYNVRLSGQDCGRGTFSQRHSVWVDQDTEERFVPLNNVRADQTAHYEVIDSLLSEAAVLGFEYGYSMAEPDTLTIWEAQFGDFANGAQVIIDQFIVPGEAKWLRMSGLVMLLPHGFEGQGPEHSSARLERYLQLCGDDNMQVVNCTTPANFFHVLRRQIHRKFRKPLIVMSPKSLLRHKRAVSRLEELGPDTTFHRLLWDDAEVLPDTPVRLQPDSKIQRVILCSGKIYYDLLEERDKRGLDSVYLMRLEQLYPFPIKALAEELERFRQAEIIWCQEEPKNMGAWHYMEDRLETLLRNMHMSHERPVYVGRRASASPAAGSMSRHKTEQEAVVDMALTL